MGKMPMIAICAFLMVALALPAFANGTSGATVRTLYKMPQKVYGGGVAIARETEGHVTGLLREAFGLFNPCLDLIKGCTGVVLIPLEKPFAYLGGAKAKPKVGMQRTDKIPVPERPALPAK